MSNYVANRILCTKQALMNYFLDEQPLGKEDPYCKENPYITFNKLLMTRDIIDYKEQYGQYPDPSHGFLWKEQADGIYEIKFYTRWHYPIHAIIRALELCREKLTWYAAEEEGIYMSKFTWQNGEVVEEVAYLEHGEFDDWWENFLKLTNEHPDKYAYPEPPENDMWIYLNEARELEWQRWPCKDFLERYRDDYPSADFYREIVRGDTSGKDSSGKERVIIDGHNSQAQTQEGAQGKNGDPVKKLTPLQQLDCLEYARVTLTTGETMEGTSWGIIPAEDDDGNDLGYDFLMFFSRDESKSMEVNDLNLLSFEELK